MKRTLNNWNVDIFVLRYLP